MRLTRRQLALLSALAEGCILKAHRDLEGHKVYRLYRLDGVIEEVSEADVHHLVDGRLLESNKKFPAASFFLTDRSAALLRRESAGSPPRGLVATSLTPPSQPAGR
jgi:hypothetical protein